MVSKILAQADARLRTHERHWQSLAPGRERAATLSAIGERVLGSGTPDPLALAWSRGIVDVAIAMRDAFPENLFWDLDHLAASLVSAGEGPDPERGAAAITEHAARLVRVQHVFGRHTPVAFRYVHDFSYGFDWAKWVAKDPAARAGTPPFSATFVDAMIARGHELHALIADGRDATYPPLAGGEARNPFGFSREPPAEARLMRHLAEHDLLPVRGWDDAHVPRWDRPYAALRRQAAHALGV
jgi:hypothetical protein